MPLLEIQPDAIAQVYARSLFELSEAKGGQAVVESTLRELEELLDLARRDPRFNEFLASQVISADKRAAALKRILAGRVSDLTSNFLQVLNEKGRLSHLPPIVAALDAVVQERFGRVEVDVYTASPASPEDLRPVRDRLAAILGKDVVVHPYTDASIIGGIKLMIGDRLLDASIATRLRRFREQLATDGSARLRAKAERILGDSTGG